jgi:hypothetical protein
MEVRNGGLGRLDDLDRVNKVSREDERLATVPASTMPAPLEQQRVDRDADAYARVGVHDEFTQRTSNCLSSKTVTAQLTLFIRRRILSDLTSSRAR